MPNQEQSPQQISRRDFLGVCAEAGMVTVFYPLQGIFLPKENLPIDHRPLTPDPPERPASKDMKELTQRALDVTSLLEEYQTITPQNSEGHKTRSFPQFIRSALINEKKYPELLKDERFLGALKYLDDSYDAFPGQSYQCYGIASLMSALFFEKLGKVLGAREVIKNVKDIVLPPDFAKRYAGWYASPTGFMALKLGGAAPNPVYTLTDMMPGDFFVEYKQDSVGHIGFVLGKEIVDNQLYFDVLEANHDRDGHIHHERLTPEQFEKKFTDGTGIAGSIALLVPERRGK